MIGVAVHTIQIHVYDNILQSLPSNLHGPLQPPHTFIPILHTFIPILHTFIPILHWPPQVHHLSSQAIMAAFAAGMASPDSSSSSPSKRPPVGSVTPAAVQCLFCVGSSLQGTLTSSPAGGGAALAGSVRIAGPAHMLQHLGKMHPRQLLQVLHTLQLLTGEGD